MSGQRRPEEAGRCKFGTSSPGSFGVSGFRVFCFGLRLLDEDLQKMCLQAVANAA